MTLMTVPQAFQSLCPNCDVNYEPKEWEIKYEDAIWLDTENNAQFTKPTKEEIEAEIARVGEISY